MNSLNDNRENETVIYIYITSSPFGMEKEKEELKRNYLPEIESICRTNNITLSLIDLLEEKEESADPIQIISRQLNKLSEADMLIEFDGKSYWWYAKNNNVFQKNFEETVQKYSQADNLKDFSILDQDLGLDQLNKVEKIPTCFCFGEKSCKKINKSEDSLFDHTSEEDIKLESEEVLTKMNQIINKSESTIKKTLGVKMDYETPEKGAEFLFKCISTHLNGFLVNRIKLEFDNIQWSVMKPHENYSFIRHQAYVEDSAAFNRLNNHINNPLAMPLCIIGKAGCGKSSLLANWKKFQTDFQKNYGLLLFHIGCKKETKTVKNILLSSIAFFYEILGKPSPLIQFELGFQTIVESLERLMEEFNTLFKKKPILLFDGLDRLEKSPSSPALYWITDRMIKLGCFIFSSRYSDNYHLHVMENRSFEMYEIFVTEKLKKGVYKKMFDDGKVKRTKIPCKLILEIKEADNLSIFKSILSESTALKDINFKTSSVLSTKSIEDLFKQSLDRLEKEFNAEEFIRKTLCALSLLNYGLTENQLRNYSKLKKQVWTPFFQSLKQFLICKDDVWQIENGKFRKAIEMKYFPTKYKLLHEERALANYLLSLYNEQKSNEEFSLSFLNELSFSLMKMKDKTELSKLINTERFFEFISLKCDLFLEVIPHFPIEKCNQLGLNVTRVIFEMIVKTYQRDEFVQAGHVLEFILSNLNLSVKNFIKFLMNYNNPCKKVQKLIKDLNQIFDLFQDLKNAFKCVEQFKILKDSEKCKLSISNASDIIKHEAFKSLIVQRAIMYKKLSLLYYDEGDFDEAYNLTEKYLKNIKDRLFDENPMEIIETMFKLSKIEKDRKNFTSAERYYLKIIDLFKKIGRKDCLLFADACLEIGIIENRKGDSNYERSFDFFSKSLDIFKRKLNNFNRNIKVVKAFEGLGYCLLKLQRYQLMEKYLWQAVENRTTMRYYESVPAYYDDLIDNYWKRKEVFKARRLFTVMPNGNQHTPKNVAALAIKQKMTRNLKSIFPDTVYTQTMNKCERWPVLNIDKSSK
ncbi:DgyrCDS796 [Dimorphilus gyrociliatus]|uniref:DgyrCDS796 n=1 Tax=Dimorphilus gyrociliatus TaxID=2664684 RepID=A0A7I8V6X5_9ANNE|nr:DgyrCDS796 [Dimorphilus gyrociliatus]